MVSESMRLVRYLSAFAHAALSFVHCEMLSSVAPSALSHRSPGQNAESVEAEVCVYYFGGGDFRRKFKDESHVCDSEDAMLAMRDQSLAEARREALREGEHRREAACAHSTGGALDGRRAGGSVWRATEPSTLTQHFVAVWGAFLVFAFISTLPRGIALLALSTQSSTSIREVLEEEVGFGDIKAGCKATDQIWTGLSYGARLHRWMIIADYACFYGWSYMAISPSMYAVFSVKSGATTAASRFVVTLLPGLAARPGQVSADVAAHSDVGGRQSSPYPGTCGA